jgi:hypothetical protein
MNLPCSPAACQLPQGRLILKSILTPPSVPMRWVMEKAQAAAIAKRLRDLRDASKKTENPVTVPMIARQCGVAVRTAAGWLSKQNPKGMTYQHCIKAAKLFDVAPDWLWDGKEKQPTPDLMGQFDGSISGRLDRIEDLQEQALERLDALTASLASISDVPESGPKTRRAGKQASATKSRRAARDKRAASR